MFNYFIVAIISYILGIITIIVFSAIKISSRNSRREEGKIDYGQEVYNIIERNEKNHKNI